jgi:hypothetical protein
LSQRIAHGDAVRRSLGWQTFCSFSSLISHTAQAKHDQGHPKEVKERGSLGLDAEKLMKDYDAPQSAITL